MKGYAMIRNDTRNSNGGTPLFRMIMNDGEVVIGFSDEDTGHDLKKTILSLILQSYEDRVVKFRNETGTLTCK